MASSKRPLLSPSAPPPKRTTIKDQRKELTKSIIATLPRSSIESLLLEAALAHGGVMGKVIDANLKRADVAEEGEGVEEEVVVGEGEEVVRERGKEEEEGEDDGDVEVDKVLASAFSSGSIFRADSSIFPLSESSRGILGAVMGTIGDGAPAGSQEGGVREGIDEEDGPMQFLHATQKQFLSMGKR